MSNSLMRDDPGLVIVQRYLVVSFRSMRSWSSGRQALTLIELIVALVLASLLMAALLRITTDIARETRQLQTERTDWGAAGLLEERMRLDLLNARGIRTGQNSMTLSGFVRPQHVPSVIRYECFRRGDQSLLLRSVGGVNELCWIGCSSLLVESLEDADPETQSSAAAGLPPVPSALRFVLLDENGQAIVSARVDHHES
ncbi:MAG: prepilin-type N-terminal cleavage/methylation domain-containing protein [Planctomycetota bacterium]